MGSRIKGIFLRDIGGRLPYTRDCKRQADHFSAETDQNCYDFGIFISIGTRCVGLWEAGKQLLEEGRIWML